MLYLTDNNTTTSYNLNNTFSKGGLTFNYPDNFKEINSSKVVSGDKTNIDLITLASPDNKTKITATTMSLASYHETIEEFKDITVTNVGKSSDFQVLGDTTLNLTDIPEAYEVVYTLTNPKTSQFNKGFYLFIGNNNQVVYGIQVFGPNDTFNNTKSLYDKLIPTIKIEN